MKKRILSIILTVTVISAMSVGCGQKQMDTTQTETTEVGERVATAGTETIEMESTETVENTEMTDVAGTEMEEPTEIEEQSPYSFTDMSAIMYAQKAVNVRDLPDTDGNKVGGLSTNDEVTVTGQCNETGWYRIDCNGGTAYVSNSYLDDSKVETTENTNSSSSSQPSTGTSSTNNESQPAASGDSGSSNAESTTSAELPSNPYPLRTLEDDGSSVSYYYLTEPGHDGVDLEMEKQVALYALSHPEKTFSTETHEYSTFVGIYQEGAVWKVTWNYN